MDDQERGRFACRFVKGVEVTKDVCLDCEEAGFDHEVKSEPEGHTGKSSCWGPGIPTTRRVCSQCNRWDGPWVSTKHVGDGW